VFRESCLEQLGSFIAPTWQALLDGARYVDDRLVEILDEVRPEVIVEDNVCAFPAIPASGIPWVQGTTSRRASGRPMSRGVRLRRPTAPSSTSAWDRWARPTWS
jgi:hypothetical protein